MLVVFDLDGTLANCEHRVGYVRSKPTNWPAFFAGIPADEVIEPVARIMRSLFTFENTIILASGRGEETRANTEQWLAQHNLACYAKLYMRAAGDYRADTVVKREILDQIITEYAKPDIVFDDRPSVVKMWREAGIFVADVYQGTEDF